MFKKLLPLVLIVLMFSIYGYSQDNGISHGLAPTVKVQYPAHLLSPNAYGSRAFGYNAYGTVVPVGPFKMWLSSTPGLVTLFTDPLGASAFVQAGSFAGDGFWYGVRYSTNALVKIDTSTGVLTQVGTVTGIGSLTGIGWDFTTNTMYGSNYVSGASNVGTLNLTTGAYTPLPANYTGTGLPIDMAVSNAGNIYVNVITAPTSPSQIWQVNKTTGVWTLVGATGYNANYAQGMSWDHAVDTGYLAAYNYTNSQGELRRINIATGATTLIATLGCEVDGMAIPGAPGPQISHTPLPNTNNLTGPYIVNAVVTPAGSPVTSSKIFWSRNSPSVFDSVTMTNTSGNNWTGNIPGNGTEATYRYYLKAMDALGRIGSMGSAASPMIFYAIGTDTTHPVITHTPLLNQPLTIWPVTVNCQATDLFGIDSVWVNWNKNHGSGTRFNMTKGSGNNWSGTFNTTPPVVVGDSIFYTITARDNSSQHNTTTTATYGFKIISQFNACVGTGTTSSSYPYYTYWMDGRTQMLFTAAELNALGMNAASIMKIGFNVITVGAPAMNNFSVKFQNTTLTTLTAWVESGWTSAFLGTYAPPATGWQYIDLQSPYFQYNGTQNLLVEVCFDNSAYSANSPVYATNISNMCRGYGTDNVSGCTMTSGSALTYRPNTCFTVTPIVGVGNESNLIPNKYSLAQNYPNPFNPVTKINFAIPKQSMVTLKVYDVLGREVKTLINEVKAAGQYIVDFDASEFSSGVYFYKLESGSFNDVKKMVLMK